jgi:hypothetical protein
MRMSTAAITWLGKIKVCFSISMCHSTPTLEGHLFASIRLLSIFFLWIQTYAYMERVCSLFCERHHVLQRSPNREGGGSPGTHIIVSTEHLPSGFMKSF